MRSLAAAAVVVVVVTSIAPAAMAVEQEIRVLVLPPTSEHVEKGILESIAGMISVELSKQKGLDVISVDEVKKLAELEAEKQSVGCTSSSCLAELAGAMGARLVVFGDAAKLGSVVVLNLNCFDSAQAKSVGRTSVKAKSLDELPDRVPAAVQDLVGPILAKQKELLAQAAAEKAAADAAAKAKASGTSTTTTTTTAASSASTPAKDDASSTTGTAPAAAAAGKPMTTMGIVGWSMVGVGALVGVAGLGYDATAGTSANGHVDTYDFIGPVGLVVGGGLVAGGIAVALVMGGGDAT